MIPYLYCPFCRAELQTRRIPASDGPERRVCSACGFIQWGNSKPTAAVVILNEVGQVLLGRRNIEPFHGWWDIPGGFLEAGEHPEVGARREVREETGVAVTSLHLIGVFMDVYGADGASGEDILNFYYAGQIEPGAVPVADDDISELAWFDPDTLPVEEVAFAANREALRTWLRGQKKELNSSGGNNG